MKGLCVRAGRITNTREAFKEAVLQYAEGLLLRGYTSAMLAKAWGSYLQDNFARQPVESRILKEWFMNWLTLYFGGSNERTEVNLRPVANRRLLLCGLDAMNAVMEAWLANFNKSDFDLINIRVQDREQSWANGNPVTTLSKVGNYNIEILLESLKVRELKFDWGDDLRSFKCVDGDAVIAGGGFHWNAFVKRDNSWWFVGKSDCYW